MKKQVLSCVASRLLEEIGNVSQESYNINENNKEYQTSSDEEYFSNLRRQRKRVELQLGDDSDTQNDAIEMADDDIEWQKVTTSCNVGRIPIYNVFKDVSGPTGYAKHNIMKGNVKSAFSLIINNKILEYIISCTKIEGRKTLETDWNFTVSKLKAFISISYAPDAYEAKKLKLSYMWSKKWGPGFFSETMSRNDFTELMRFILFDKRSDREERLRSDKFA